MFLIPGLVLYFTLWNLKYWFWIVTTCPHLRFNKHSIFVYKAQTNAWFKYWIRAKGKCFNVPQTLWSLAGRSGGASKFGRIEVTFPETGSTTTVTTRNVASSKLFWYFTPACLQHCVHVSLLTLPALASDSPLALLFTYLLFAVRGLAALPGSLSPLLVCVAFLLSLHISVVVLRHLGYFFNRVPTALHRSGTGVPI